MSVETENARLHALADERLNVDERNRMETLADIIEDQVWRLLESEPSVPRVEAAQMAQACCNAFKDRYIEWFGRS